MCCFILCFILGLRLFAGFKNARSWLADVREHADPHLTCILVGNKVDLCEADGPSSDTETIRSSSAGPRRQVPTAEAEQWAKEEGLLFVEASAKSGQNVEVAFEQAARNILDKIKKGVFDDDRVSQNTLHCSLRVSHLRLCSHRASNCRNPTTVSP